MKIGRRHWLAASLVAVAAHGALVLLLWEPAESGAANLGTGGMEISFGMAGGAPGATAVPPPTAKTVEVSETPGVVPTEAVPVETVDTIESAVPPEVSAIEPAPTEPVPVAEVPPRTVTARVPKKPRPPKEVEPVPPVEDVEPEAAEQETVEAAPKEVAAQTPAETPAEPQTKAPSVAGSAGKSGTEKSANTGSGTSASAGGRPGSADSYFERLQAWLEEHKEYPASARRRRHEGMAVLNFTMNSAGEVLAARIVRGTGHAILDEEVMSMIQRAAPLPAFPDDFEQGRLTLSVPVQFRLR